MPKKPKILSIIIQDLEKVQLQSKDVSFKILTVYNVTFIQNLGFNTDVTL